MRTWEATRIAAAAGASLRRGADGGPERVVIDSREAGPGDLFVALPGERVDGGEFAAAALSSGAWGVLVEPSRAAGLPTGGGAVLAAASPLAAMQALATAWRRALGVPVIGITGSVGKTSTKDLLRALLAPQRQVHASRANFNTEIGLPLELLRAPEDTEVLVLEMGMRGAGQIAELARIAEPDVGVVTAVGPVHVELLGSVEAVAAAKAELLHGLRPGGTAVVPHADPLLAPVLPPDVRTVTFGPGGDVDESALDALQLPFTSAHMRRNACAAMAAARAVGVEPEGRVDLELSAMRGQRVRAAAGATVVDDCYNANPLSMRAALDDLAAAEVPAGSRRIAVLGDMLELGPEEVALHRETGAHAAATGVDVLVTVGPLAREMALGFGEEGVVISVPDAGGAVIALDALRPAGGDVVLVKASRGVALEAVTRALVAA